MDKVNLCALVGFYQDAHAGQRLHRNLESYEIPSYWIDSRVEGFPQLSENNLSTDGLREIVASGKYSKLIDAPIPQRPGYYLSMFFKNAKPLGFDHVMVLGCDEYLTGDLELLKENLAKLDLKEPHKIRLRFVEHNPQTNNNLKHVTERIINMPEYVSIKEIHWLYYHNKFGYDKIMEKSPLVLGMEIHHDDKIRPEFRNKIMDIFQAKRQKFEQEELAKVFDPLVKQELQVKESRMIEKAEKCFVKKT